MPFSSLVLDIGHLEKRFPESIMQSLACEAPDAFPVVASLPPDDRKCVWRFAGYVKLWDETKLLRFAESASTDSRPPFERGWVRSIEPTVSICGWPAGKSSIRKVECRMRKLASTMPKVGQKLKGKMLNVGCEKVNVHPTELEGRIRKLDCCVWKVKVERENLNVA